MDPLSDELCTYTLPVGGSSYYVLTTTDAVWLGDFVNSRLLRLRPSTDQLTYWEQPTDSEPFGLTLSPAGDLWYADPNLGLLGRLRPAQDEVTVFNPPRGFWIDMLALVGDQVCYTDYFDGAVGRLDPALAAGTTSAAARGVDFCLSFLIKYST